MLYAKLTVPSICLSVHVTVETLHMVLSNKLITTKLCDVRVKLMCLMALRMERGGQSVSSEALVSHFPTEFLFLNIN